MLKFVIGEKNSGKSEYCIREAAKCGGRAIIIVPEQLSHTVENKVAGKMGVFGLGGIEVLSFNQMANRALSFLENAACRHIDNAGKVMILYKIITGEESFSLLRGNEEEKAVCVMNIISEFKRYGVLPEDIDAACDKIRDKALFGKLSEISVAYKKFEENISGKFINGDDNLAKFAASSYAREKYKDFDIYIDCFSSFTGAEINCIKMFFEVARSVTVTLCMDFKRKNEAQFSVCYNTYQRILKIAEKAGVKTQPTVILNKKNRDCEGLLYLENAYFDATAVPYKNKCDEIEVFAGKNMFSEIEHAAATIRRLVIYEGYLYRDFAVICCNMNTYGEYVKTVFEKYDIKVFSDIKTNIANHPVASFIISAVMVITKGYTYTNIFRCLKHGFSDLDDEECDLLENFVLESGARGNVWQSAEKWVEFTNNFFNKNYDESEEVNLRKDAVIRVGVKALEPFAALHKNINASMMVSEKCKAVYLFLEQLDVPGKLIRAAEYFESIDDSYTAIEYKSVYNKIIDVLDEMCEAMGDDKISTAKFGEILKCGISQFEIGKIPALKDGVTCGDINSIKQISAPIVLVLGMNDGFFPISLDTTGFFNDFDRQRIKMHGIELAADAAEKALEGEYLIYRLFCAAEKRLYLSYSISSIDGSALRQAWAIEKIRKIMPCITQKDDIIKKDKSDLLTAPEAAFKNLMLSLSKGGEHSREYSTAYRWFEKSEKWSGRLLNAVKALDYKNKTVSMGREITEKLYGEEMTTAVTRLEKFSACPFSYYMRYVLGAQPRKVKSFQAKDAGVLLHSVIEEFSKRLSANGIKWESVTDEYIKKEVREILFASDSRFERIMTVPGQHGTRIFLRLCDTLENAIKLIVIHINRGKFQPMGYEVKFSDGGEIEPVKINLSNGKKVCLTGIIDRLDTFKSESGTYFRVVDYKSGNKEFDLGEVYYGITLQLAVYLSAAQNAVKNGKPAGMLYFRLSNPMLSADPFLSDETLNDMKIKQLKLSGLLVSSDEILSNMDVEEKFDFLPVQKLKSGKFSGSIATEENFEGLRRYITKTVLNLAGGIFSGKTDISPYKTKGASACDFCDFGDACSFDLSLGCRYRSILKLDKQDIWKNIEELNNEN